MRTMVLYLLVFFIFVSPLYSQVSEVPVGVSFESQFLPVISMSPNFWQEFDITFWQTAPFAVFWAYLIDEQVINNLLQLGAGPHWEVVLATSVLISAGNAYWQAQRSSLEN